MVYNFRDGLSHDGHTPRSGINLIGNYYKRGPNSERLYPFGFIKPGQYYVAGNYIECIGEIGDPRDENVEFPRWIQYNRDGGKKMEITDKNEIEDILNNATVIRLAMCDGDMPYVVPVAFGYKDDEIYFHSSRKGMKMDILRKNSNVCFEVETGVELTKGEKACNYDFRYKSVIGFGTAHIVENEEEKLKGLDTIMEHYSEPPFEYKPEMVKAVGIIRIDIEDMKGKKSDGATFA